MINLIPLRARGEVTRDFYYKIVFLFFSMFGFCILVASICLLPSYVASSLKQSLINQKLETQKNTPLPTFDEQTLVAIKDINSKLDLVENSEKNKFLISEKVIKAVLLNKRPDVKITQILYEENEKTGKKINLTGTAPSRAILLLFRQELENNSVFKSVDLPISNFIKGSNIQFSLSLSPA